MNNNYAQQSTVQQQSIQPNQQTQNISQPANYNNILNNQQNINPYVGLPQNNYIQPQQGYWNTQAFQPQQNQYQYQQEEKEYILMDSNVPNKKKKYVYVGEVDAPINNFTQQQSFTLDDIRAIIAKEFDTRFGEEKK